MQHEVWIELNVDFIPGYDVNMNYTQKGCFIDLKMCKNRKSLVK